jgi:hypothetical protein
MSAKLSYGPWMVFTACSKCGEIVSSATVTAKCLVCGTGKPFVEKPGRRVYQEPGFIQGLLGTPAIQVSVEYKP